MGITGTGYRLNKLYLTTCRWRGHYAGCFCKYVCLKTGLAWDWTPFLLCMNIYKMLGGLFLGQRNCCWITLWLCMLLVAKEVYFAHKRFTYDIRCLGWKLNVSFILKYCIATVSGRCSKVKRFLLTKMF